MSLFHYDSRRKIISIINTKTYKTYEIHQEHVYLHAQIGNDAKKLYLSTELLVKFLLSLLSYIGVNIHIV